jgi:hypothetical protein
MARALEFLQLQLLRYSIDDQHTIIELNLSEQNCFRTSILETTLMVFSLRLNYNFGSLFLLNHGIGPVILKSVSFSPSSNFDFKMMM